MEEARALPADCIDGTDCDNSIMFVCGLAFAENTEDTVW
jgi:hypothetical protein